jgi:hypothetical protein
MQEVGSGNNASESIWEIPRSNIGRDYPDSSFHGYLQPLQKIVGILPSFIQLPLPSIYFKFIVRYHKTLYAQYPEVLSSSLGKLQTKGEVVRVLN